MNDFSKYIGIPFEPCGCAYNGINCWNLIRLIYKEALNIALPSYDDEYIDAHKYDLIAEATELHSSEWIKIFPGTEQPFDVVLIAIRGLPVHIGMIVKFGWMLHIHVKINSCLERYNTPLWSKRIKGFYRYAK